MPAAKTGSCVARFDIGAGAPSGSRAPPIGGRTAPDRRVAARAAAPLPYTPVSGPVLSLMRSTLTPTFSSRVSPRFMNGVCRS